MALVLYDGKAIAFGPCEEIFARVRNATGQVATAREPAPARQPPPARPPAAAAADFKTARRAPIAESVEP
jgi:hypothetical protein